ncbi:hypothetical protein GUITHDRAFT_70887 [Guillardia theta CCMP2712]|uniref:AB hydrolase-1 domain-containing protein n=2 Tax=Guillardia theta TaxID=55529 RepID=L1JD82_GUITC|nr:hypothetical protein GUITHDRAFT_70887 [Guillardia theta CCMP2712]EKX46065.1 hypothetical protein GUITHDRAFT_70887 [Guillardia theta CCMP2712]|eukprot:XP_005833045.1 hypothetical protein GUITHDRAFT_70887 [Guillardia theta CCMP2712]
MAENPPAAYNWCLSSRDVCSFYERKLLRSVKVPYLIRDVKLGETCTLSPKEKRFQGHWIHTLATRDQGAEAGQNKQTLVLLHGMGCGLSVYHQCIDELSSRYHVVAIDMPGFGLSSRPKFPEGAEEVEEMFVQALEIWRREMKLSSFVLGGHSFGGYIASCFALKYPSLCSSLVLIDAWGFPELDPERIRKISPFLRTVNHIFMHVTDPVSMLRMFGPLGFSVFRRFRKRMVRRLDQETADALVSYLYHCNVCDVPTGPRGFRHLCGPLAFAKRPLLPRVEELNELLPVTFIYGQESWINSDSGYEVRNRRRKMHTGVHVIAEAGHNIHFDQPHLLCHAILSCHPPPAHLKQLEIPRDFKFSV